MIRSVLLELMKMCATQHTCIIPLSIQVASDEFYLRGFYYCEYIEGEVAHKIVAILLYCKQCSKNGFVFIHFQCLCPGPMLEKCSIETKFQMAEWGFELRHLCSVAQRTHHYTMASSQFSFFYFIHYVCMCTICV